jgi:TIR domain
MSEAYRYDAFISYRRQEPDKAFARQLLKDLEAAGYCIAFDERDFPGNASFLQEMERCVKESRFTLDFLHEPEEALRMNSGATQTKPACAG